MTHRMGQLATCPRAPGSRQLRFAAWRTLRHAHATACGAAHAALRGMRVRCGKPGALTALPACRAAPQGGCRYHSGPPVFHDGGKEWSCCHARSHDFGLFMSLPGCARQRPGAALRGCRLTLRCAAAPRRRLRSCTVGRHTQEKPPKPAASASARGPAPTPLPRPMSGAPAAVAPTRAACLRCRQGFFCADHPAEATPAPPPPPPAVRASPGGGQLQRNGAVSSAHALVRRTQPPKPPADPDAVQTCRNKGCGNKARAGSPGSALRLRARLADSARPAALQFKERDNSDEACRFHPGPPIFHERQKGWACCNKARRAWRGGDVRSAHELHARAASCRPPQVVYDFDEFLSIPTCAAGRHCADPEGAGAGYARLGAGAGK